MVVRKGTEKAIDDANNRVAQSSASQIAIGNGRYAEDLQELDNIVAETPLPIYPPMLTIQLLSI